MDRLENFQKLRNDILTLPDIIYFLGHGIYFATAIGLAYDSLRTRIVPKIPKMYPPSSRADDLLSDLTRWIVKMERRSSSPTYISQTCTSHSTLQIAIDISSAM